MEVTSRQRASALLDAWLGHLFWILWLGSRSFLYLLWPLPCDTWAAQQYVGLGGSQGSWQEHVVWGCREGRRAVALRTPFVLLLLSLGGTDEFTSSALAETQGTAEGRGQNCGIGESWISWIEFSQPSTPAAASEFVVFDVEIRQSEKKTVSHTPEFMDEDWWPSWSDIFMSVWKTKSWLHFSVIPSMTVTFWLSTSSQQQASVRTGYLYFVLLDFPSLQCTVVHFEELLFLHLIMKSILNWDRVNHWVSLASSWERFSFSLT